MFIKTRGSFFLKI